MELRKSSLVSEISDHSMIYHLPNDILGEIIYHLPYTQTRSINKNFKIVSDNIELTRRASVPVDYRDFLKEEFCHEFITTKPKRLSYLMANEYLPRRLFSQDESVYRSTEITGGITRMSISEIITELTTENVIPGPQFVRFILSKHPLHYNLSFLRKKFVATCELLLNECDRYFMCCRWDLSYNILEQLEKIKDYSETILNNECTVQTPNRNSKTLAPWYNNLQNLQPNTNIQPDNPSSPFAFISGVFVGLLFGTFIITLVRKF
jgi:hypothetical protein